MASSLTTAVATVPNPQAALLETKHKDQLAGFQKSCLDLAKRSLTGMTAQLAQELDTKAKAFIDAAEKERVAMKAPALETCQRIDAFFARLVLSARAARFLCTGVGAKEGGAFALRQLGIDPMKHTNIIGSYNLEQRQKAAAQKREDDRLALARAQADRKADVDALIDQAANGDPAAAEEILAEAVAIDAAPVIPVIMPALAPPKVEGTSTRFELVGDVTDLPALLTWIMEGKRYDIFDELYDLRESGLKAVLKRGLRPDGVGNYREVPIVSNRSRG